jgi:hypothetical protein
MEERIIKGIWIPIEIWEAEDLSWNEKILLMEIDSFTTKGKDCFISDERVANMLNTSTRNASRMMTNLIEKGYVIRTKFDGRRRFVESCLGAAASPILAQQSGQKCRTTYNNIPNEEDKSSSICNKGFDFKKSLIALGVSQQIASDWVSVRKGKKATNTETAFKSIEREILKSGRSAEECITIAVENSWSGFKAEWLLNQQQRQTPPSGKKSVLQNNMEVAEQLMRMANIGEYE